MKKKQKAFIILSILIAILLFILLYHLNLAYHLLGYFEGSGWKSYSFTYYDTTQIEQKCFLVIRYYNPLTGEIQGSFDYFESGESTYYKAGKWQTDPISIQYGPCRFISQLDRKNLTMEVECDSGRTVQLNYNMDRGYWEYNDINLYYNSD